MRILIDLDGTVADWGAQWDRILDRDYPMSNAPRTKDQTTFNLRTGLNEADLQVVTDVMDHPGFYASLKPIPGAISAITDMHNGGHNVFLVSTPTVSNPTCAQDKYEWVESHLGEFWTSRLILTHDKTIIAGDVLFDDRPDIHGAERYPWWKQILFDQPYNQDSFLPRIDNWLQWSSAADLAMKVSDVGVLA